MVIQVLLGLTKALSDIKDVPVPIEAEVDDRWLAWGIQSGASGDVPN